MYIVVVYISDISPPFLVLNLTIYVVKKEIYFRILLDSVIMIFFTSPFKRGTSFFSKAMSSQSFITIRTWTKNHAFQNWEIPKSPSPFLGSQKNPRPKTQPGTANLRSAELWRDWNSAGWGWDPRWPRCQPPTTLPRGRFPRWQWGWTGSRMMGKLMMSLMAEKWIGGDSQIQQMGVAPLLLGHPRNFQRAV